MRSAVDIGFGVISAVGFLYAVGDVPATSFEAGGLDWIDQVAELQPAWVTCVEYATVVWLLSELVVLLFNEKRRALHDFIAGTVVVRVPGRDLFA